MLINKIGKLRNNGRNNIRTLKLQQTKPKKKLNINLYLFLVFFAYVFCFISER